jgi:hypothetical protein
VSADGDAELRRECERLQQRYAVEIVEAFGLCPYAERARLDGRSADVVIADEAPTDERVLEAVRALGADERVEVAFAIFPRLRIERLALAAWVERLRHAHQSEAGGLVMTMEGFHPDAPPDLSTAGRLVPFLRRTPVPTIQLTRLSSLNRVRRSGPSGTGFVDVASIDLKAFLATPPAESVSERIAENNRDKVREVGIAAIEAVLDDIFRDRDVTFARLGVR